MLFAHPMPDHIVISQIPPAMRDLRSFTQRGCVEIAKNLERYFRWESCQKVDPDQVAYAGGKEGELRKAALC